MIHRISISRSSSEDVSIKKLCVVRFVSTCLTPLQSCLNWAVLVPEFQNSVFALNMVASEWLCEISSRMIDFITSRQDDRHFDIRFDGIMNHQSLLKWIQNICKSG
jgi:hypothetical protein